MSRVRLDVFGYLSQLLNAKVALVCVGLPRDDTNIPANVSEARNDPVDAWFVGTDGPSYRNDRNTVYGAHPWHPVGLQFVDDPIVVRKTGDLRPSYCVGG